MLTIERYGLGECADLVGESEPMLRMKDLIHRIAPTEATVLITGETGTGKELVARMVHSLSPRAKNAFVCVNCTAIPDTLLESELFGFEKGSFTGAVARQEGKLKQADSGTVFLDEIGDMSSMAQAKVLRAIETREIQPLGSSSAQLDLRILAATHQDLEQLASEHRFRSDLFFRLSVVPVRLPPLRDRRSDILQLVEHFIHHLNEQYDRDVEGISSAALKFLLAQDWPGNVRQLRNVIEGAFVVCSRRWIEKSDLTVLHWSSPHAARLTARVNSEFRQPFSAEIDPERLLGALHAMRWNKSKTARLLHLSRMTLYRKISKYGIHRVGDPEPDKPDLM